MNVAVIGSGYVGLVAGVCLAEGGHRVFCADNSEQRVCDLNEVKPGSHDPELTPLLTQELQKNMISFTADVKSVVQNAKNIIVAVGTPEGEDGRANLESIFDVCKVIGDSITESKTIMIKSTVPIGTTDKFRQLLLDRLANRGLTFNPVVVHTPEFLVAGKAIEGFKELDRLVIGCKPGDDVQSIIDLFSPYTPEPSRVLIMDTKEAELCKYMNNCMLATRISFVNEMSNIAKAYGVDIYGPLRSMKLDKRIGSHYLHPGLGYGGSCLPKDVKALIGMGQDAGYDVAFLQAVDVLNDGQVPIFCNTIKEYFNGSLAGKKIAVWGVSFKAGTVDTRKSPGLQVIDFLNANGAIVKLYDSNIKDCEFLPDGVSINNSKEDVLIDSDALVVCTDEQEFAEFNFEEMKKNPSKPDVIFDGKGKLKLQLLRDLGFEYYVAGKFHNRDDALDQK